MRVEIRFHPPKFSKKAVCEYFGVRTLPIWVKSKPNWDDVKRLGQTHRIHQNSVTDWDELLSILSPNLKVTRYGIYTENIDRESIKENYSKDGRFLCEGWNHIHLHGIVKNPVAQYMLGLHAIRSWISNLGNLKKLPKVVIYLNDNDLGGSKAFVLCLYSNATPANIRNLERNWPCVSVLNAKNFLKWAFE